MINMHLHCRDEEQAYKETIKHALHFAYRIGSSTISDVGNLDNAVITEERVLRRFELAEQADEPIFYGTYILLTPDSEQVGKAAETHMKYFPKKGDRVGVVGLKMFAGKSVGNTSVVKEDEQRLVYRVLAGKNYRGVLAVHCEKESLMRPDLWDPMNPASHLEARPRECEIESVKDQIKFAREAGFAVGKGKGHLHIFHVSVPESVYLVNEAKSGGMSISCGVTPHHCLLDVSYMNLKVYSWEDAISRKVNPPLRLPGDAEGVRDCLLSRKINVIEEDHAPHSLDEKTGKAFDAKGNPQYLSGFPTLSFVPHFINFLRRRKMSEDAIIALTHRNIEEILQIRHLELPIRDVEPDYNLHEEYQVDVYRGVRERLGK